MMHVPHAHTMHEMGAGGKYLPRSPKAVCPSPPGIPAAVLSGSFGHGESA